MLYVASLKAQNKSKGHLLFWCIISEWHQAKVSLVRENVLVVNGQSVLFQGQTSLRTGHTQNQLVMPYYIRQVADAQEVTAPRLAWKA